MTSDLKEVFDEYLKSNPGFLKRFSNLSSDILETQLSSYGIDYSLRILDAATKHGISPNEVAHVMNNQGVSNPDNLTSEHIKNQQAKDAEDTRNFALAVTGGLIGYSAALASNQNPNDLKSTNNSTIFSSLLGSNQQQIG